MWFCGFNVSRPAPYQNSTCYKQIGAPFKTNYKLINSEEVSQIQSHWNKIIQFICPESFLIVGSLTLVLSIIFTLTSLNPSCPTTNK